MKKVGIIGLGKSGRSAIDFLALRGYTLYAIDDKQAVLPEGVSLLTDDVLAELDFIVISPGIALTHPVALKAKARRIEVICDVELAFRAMTSNKPRILAITGSNGKTTTTMLVGHILQAKTVGNIGMPILSSLDDRSETLVAELSSFQLETCSTKVLDAACILNITPNHLDRHGTMEEYIRVKRKIGDSVVPGGQFWLQHALKYCKDHFHFGFEEECELYTDTKSLFYFGKKECDLPELLQNSRSHDVENFLAAYALCRSCGVDPEAIRQAYATFTKPKHRLQFVREHNGISFYDDSKATSIDAVLRAVESLTTPIVLIAGGVHKGYPYDAWRKAFPGKVKACVLIGKARDIIEQDLQNAVPTYKAESLQEALNKAVGLASARESVMLSPGCASYDMFSSFEERGMAFQELVAKLP